MGFAPNCLFAIVPDDEQTGSNSAVHVLEGIGRTDIATLSGRAPSAQCFSPACHSGVLDFCSSLLQIDVDRTSNQFCDRGTVTFERVCNLAIWPDLTNSAVRSIVSFMT